MVNKESPEFPQMLFSMSHKESRGELDKICRCSVRFKMNHIIMTMAGELNFQKHYFSCLLYTNIFYFFHLMINKFPNFNIPPPFWKDF